MKKLSAAAVLLVLVTSGCSQQTSRPPARLSGTHTLAVAGEFIFVTSTDRAELRAIDTSASPPDFVRAPNPLEPLSIPSVDSPDTISRDLLWDRKVAADGAITHTTDERVGQYVYAWSNGGQQISAVGASRDSLREEFRISVGQPITAVAARGADGAASALYFASYVGVGGTIVSSLYTQSVPAAGGVLPSFSAVANARWSGETVTAIAVLPHGRQLIVATRSATGGGNVYWLDADSALATQSLRFPPGPGGPLTQCADVSRGVTGLLDVNGAPISRSRCGFSAPVRQLRVDARDLTRIRVFGLLDETSCADGTCSGIEAVELSYSATDFSQPSSIAIARDVLGVPMAKIPSTGGLFTAFDISAGGAVRHPDQAFTFLFNALGLASQGNGDISVFDASDLRLVDLNDDGPTATNTSRRAAGGDLSGGPRDFSFGDGAARSENIDIVFEGAISEPASVGASFTVPLSIRGDVEANDYVSLEGQGCAADLAISAVAPDGTVTAGPVPAECAGGSFVFRAGAGSTRPFTVRGATTGYMGRTAVGQAFVFPKADYESRLARYFHHSKSAFHEPDTETVQNAPKAIPDPQVSFTLNPAPADIARNDRYVLEVNSNFRPLNARVDPENARFTNYFVPEGIVRSPRVDRVFVAYPAVNTVLEMNLAAFDGSQGIYAIAPPFL